jgi:hypothetical protein
MSADSAMELESEVFPNAIVLTTKQFEVARNNVGRAFLLSCHARAFVQPQ